MAVSLEQPDGLAREIGSLLGERHGSLAANLVQFARVLKGADLDVAGSNVIDAARSLALIDPGRRDDFYAALRANLVSHVEDYPTFQMLFDLYWRSDRSADRELLPRARYAEGAATRRRQRAGRRVPLEAQVAYDPQGDNQERTFSEADLITSKDFSNYDAVDVKQARRIVRQMAPKLATALSRRTRAARRGGPVDLRRSLRRSVKYGGEVFDLYRQRRRVSALRLVVLCDVSGSMDIYSRFLVQFLYALQSELRHIATFVFSTRLNEVTHLLKARSFDEALARVRGEVDSWSGGTNIGASLYTFERRYARQRLGPRTVLIIISDGWDRGDTTLITRAMSALRRRTHSIIWLNPLLGDPDYQPLAKGMAAALPHVDYFLPAHNLESLLRLSRTLVYLAHG
ncbi:MAG TPA: VWA domain-containing protein [Dehalococcoidia bacterium]|nr:VWA domain-containing protein [Dehalococcoidia bacterium]